MKATRSPSYSKRQIILDDIDKILSLTDTEEEIDQVRKDFKEELKILKDSDSRDYVDEGTGYSDFAEQLFNKRIQFLKKVKSYEL